MYFIFFFVLKRCENVSMQNRGDSQTSVMSKMSITLQELIVITQIVHQVKCKVNSAITIC